MSPVALSPQEPQWLLAGSSDNPSCMQGYNDALTDCHFNATRRY